MKDLLTFHPTTIVLQSSDNFNGTPQLDTNDPDVVTLKSSAVFQQQIGGGLFAFHDFPIFVDNIFVKDNTPGGGTFNVYLVLTSGYGSLIQGKIPLATAISDKGVLSIKRVLTSGQAISIESTGAHNPICGMVAWRIMPGNMTV